MNDGLKIESNIKDLLEVFRFLPERIKQAVKTGLVRGLILAEDNVRSGAAVKFSGGRSGLMSRLTSFADTVRGGLSLDGVIGFRKTRGFPYEYAQEFGAKAKAGGAMAIPVSPEAKRLSEQGISAKDFPGILFIPGGRNILVGFDAGLGTLGTHYVLVKSIKPRLHFRESVEKSLPMIAGEITEELERVA